MSEKQVEISSPGGFHIRSLVFLPDGKYLLSGGDDAMIRQWRISDGVQVGEGMKPGSKVTAMDLSANGQWIISGGERVVNVWSMKSRQVVLTVSEHSDWVDTVHVSPDSTKLATGSNDKKAFVWDISTGKRLVGPLKHADRVGAVRFSPDGARITTCTASGGIRIYDAHNGELLRTIPVSIASYPTPVTWSSSQSVFALVSQKTLMHIDVDSGQSFSSWAIPGDPVTNFGSIAFGSIASSSNGRFVVSFVGSFVSLWDTSTSARIGSETRLPADIWSIALSSDSKYLAISDAKGKITLHQLKDIVSAYYLLRQKPVQQPQNRSGYELQSQIEALHSQLCALQSRVDEISGAASQRHELVETTQAASQLPSRLAWASIGSSNNTTEPHSRPVGVSDGIYRIKSNADDLYLTSSQDGDSTVVVQPLDRSSISQTWSISLVADGAYSVIGHPVAASDIPLTAGNSDALVRVPSGHTSTWTIEPRGDAYVIGNVEDARALHFSDDHHRVLVLDRNNSQNQRWVLEHVMH